MESFLADSKFFFSYDSNNNIELLITFEQFLKKNYEQRPRIKGGWRQTKQNSTLL